MVVIGRAIPVNQLDGPTPINAYLGQPDAYLGQPPADWF
jgi:hypothetical protein